MAPAPMIAIRCAVQQVGVLTRASGESGSRLPHNATPAYNTYQDKELWKRRVISNTAEYALRAVVHLATHGDQPSTAQQIAEMTHVPAGYISKVLQDLVKAGIAHSQRGPNGGFILAAPPEKLSVLDVVNAVDPIQRIRECPLKLPAHGRNLCVLHQRLDDAIAAVEQMFARSTIAEMIKPSRAGSKCLFPTIDGEHARTRKSGD